MATQSILEINKLGSGKSRRSQYLPIGGLAISLILSLAACGPKKSSFSLLAETNQFSQSNDTNNKVDILWVVDGSGTMANHQSNLANNFGTFISSFASKGFDFHMAIASTDAWIREKNYNDGTCITNPNPSESPSTIYKSSADCKVTQATFGDLTAFRDGDIYGPIGGAATHSGTYLITSLMGSSDITSLFSANIMVGTRGDGAQESGFQSLRAVLRRNEDGTEGYGGETHTDLADFRRSDAFLAVIIVTDEEDQSTKQDGSAYADQNEYVSSFISFLDGYTGSAAGSRNYNVSSITIDDINNCSYGLHAQATQGDRYVAISNATNGVVGSICSPDFSTQLESFAQKVVTLSTRFKLAVEPKIESLSIKVNGETIPNDSTNGWTYVAESSQHFIEFHGTGVPPQGASIAVNYDPAKLK